MNFPMLLVKKIKNITFNDLEFDKTQSMKITFTSLLSFSKKFELIYYIILAVKKTSQWKKNIYYKAIN